jgi:hypothetical protein
MPDNSCMTPQGFNENSRLRASDADRDAAASVVNNAMAEGRLTAEEHADRLDAIYSAKTHAELVPLLDDLPAASGAAAVPARVPAGTGAELAAHGRRRPIRTIFSGTSRKGAWHPDPVMSVVTIFGGTELDFRDAVLPAREIVVHATTVLGGLEITVPPEMRVVDNTSAILGGTEVTGETAESAGPDVPVLRVEGTCVLGGVEVKHKRRKGPGRKGINVSIDQVGPLPAIRIRSAGSDD